MRIRFRKNNKKTYLGIAGFLVLLLLVGVLLNWRMETFLSHNVCYGLNMDSRVQAELMEVKLDAELDALENKAEHITNTGGNWQESVANGDIKYERDNFVREGILNINGRALYGADLHLDVFPGIRESLRGNRAVCYYSGSGILFTVPVFNGKNVQYVLYRHIDKGGIDGYFHLRNNSLLGQAALVSPEGELMVTGNDKGIKQVWLEPEMKKVFGELLKELRTQKSAAKQFSLKGETMYASASGVWQSGFILVGLASAQNIYAGLTDISKMLLSVFALLALLFLIGIYFFLLEEEEKHQIEQQRTETIWRMSLNTVQTLAQAIDAKDSYTNGHSLRVAKYSVMLAERMGFNAEDQGRLQYIALLHDVGKIGIADSILNKNGKLTDEEYEIIKSHSSIGAKILSNINELPDVATGAKYHHERYDGKGYPAGLKGEEIPLIARIIAVADTYDAMTSKRSYRDALPQDVVREEISKGLGSQFDPSIGSIMLQIIDEDKEYTLRELALD
ncbi:MAG: HD-GYP domain-containing protein [Phascolarctobacterium sp.]